MANDYPREKNVSKEEAAKWNIDTRLARGGSIRSNFGETSEAIFMNSGFCYDSAETAENRFNGEEPGYVYSRYLNPTLSMLEQKLELIENAERCCVVASGMAAVFASIMCHMKTGDHIVANRVLFGSCYYIITEILPRYGIEITLVDGTKNEEWEKAFKPNTRCVFIETPSNPNLELTDIAYVASLCKSSDAKLIIDNVFATALYQSPLELGADIVVYSTTKHMDGQGRSLGGAVLGDAEFIDEVLLPFHRHTGPALSPFNAWVTLKGLETFSLRVNRQTDNATKLAEFLSEHKGITKVIYPGLGSHPQYAIAQKQMKRGGTLIACEVAGGKEAAFALMNGLRIGDISNNLGDAKTLVTHPATTTHSNIEENERDNIGISNGLLRISVGIEDIDDLIQDFDQALSPKMHQNIAS